MAVGNWVYEITSSSGTGGGPTDIAAAPPVTIDKAEVILRSDHRVEVDVYWTKNAAATATNFLGVDVYLEDPDISSGANQDLNGTDMPLDASAQVSGKWVPIHVNKQTKSPAVVFLDSIMGSRPGQTYKAPRDVRIYLAAYGPNAVAKLVRATDPNPTPNIVETIPVAPGSGESGQEYAFLVSDVSVEVTTEYDLLPPDYFLTFRYTPPDPAAPVPPNLNNFGGVRIKYVYYDADGNPDFSQPPTDSGVDVPASQGSDGIRSPAYPAVQGGKFRCYFCSEDDSQPLGNHINSLVDGVTPWVDAIVPPLPGAPVVGNFTIFGQRIFWMLNGFFAAEAQFAWELPTASGNVRYAGVYLYLVDVAGATPFPKRLTSQMANVETDYTLQIPDIPASPETWTIAAISVDVNGVLADDPAAYGQAGFHSPTVTWDIGPPTPGSPGGGREVAPLVTVDAGATATPTETLSADGVRMVSFDVGSWTNPDDNQFGGVQVAMVIDHDPSTPTYWQVPKGDTAFTTPAVPSFGNIGSSVQVDFYLVSDDPQGQKNSLVPGTTPVISYQYAPTRGEIIPARSGWFDDSQFSWSGDGFTADNLSAKVVQVGKILVVGGAPASFGASDNGQIAVLNSQGKLLDWFGQQQPGQGNSQPLWGAWLGQVWVGGTNPLDAPIFVDNQGIVEVGGIAAAHGSKYPYISVRDQYGFEAGRIGAQLSVPSGSPGDAVGSSPPQLTAGAWFTQLAVGGRDLSNWNVLITPDPTSPNGSQFQMRNVNTLQIDYKEQVGTPSNAHYQLQFGNNVWTGANLSGQFRFPGIHITEIDNSQNLFGAVFLNRGMVLRGPGAQGYTPLVSLVTYNGVPSGNDTPARFWGELNMYSPVSPYNPTVQITSGSAANSNATFVMRDYYTQSPLFFVDVQGDTYIKGVLHGGYGGYQPVTAYAYSVGTTANPKPVIDASGNWVGNPIVTVGGQTPWVQNINAAGYSLSGAGNISAATFSLNNGTAIIRADGAYIGPAIGTGGIWCGSISNSGNMDCGLIHSNNNIVCGLQQPASLAGTGWLAGDQISVLGTAKVGGLWVSNIAAINTDCQFIGNGVNIREHGIACGYLATNQQPGNANYIDTGNINASGIIGAFGYQTSAGLLVIDSNGRWVGAGAYAYGYGFGVGNITVKNRNETAWGAIECGQLIVHGAFSADTLVASGNFDAASFSVRDQTVINTDAVFTGHGVNVGGYAVYCGSLRTFRTGGGDSSVGAELIISSGEIQAGSWCRAGGYVANGQLVINSDATMLAVKYYIFTWSWGQPVIDSNGAFTGSSINLWNNGSVSCGSIDMHGGQLSNCGTLVVNGPIYCNGNIGAYGYWGGGSQGYPSVQIVRVDGAFIGPGVDVLGGSIACAYLTTQGRGGANSVDTGTVNAATGIYCWNGPIYANYIQSQTTLYAVSGFQGGPFTGNGVNTGGSCNANGGYTGGSFRGQGVDCYGYNINCGSFHINGNHLVINNIECINFGGPGPAVWTGSGVQCNDRVYGNLFGIYGVADGRSGTFTLALAAGGSQVLRFMNGLFVGTPNLELKEVSEDGKDVFVRPEGTAAVDADRPGEDASARRGRRPVARHGAGAQKPGHRRRPAAKFRPAGAGQPRRRALRAGAGAAGVYRRRPARRAGAGSGG